MNGELAALYSTNLPTHGAFFRLDNPLTLDPITGQIAFDQAEPQDLNQNGFDDFFEVSQPASGTSRGLFETTVDRGTVTATWSRAAGSATGTCRLRLTGLEFGQWPEFTHTFELLEYAGNFVYSPGTNTVTGTLNLAQAGTPANTLSGALTLARAATKSFDQLVLLPGSLLNSAGQVMLYDGTGLARDTSTKTNYFGFVTLVDGDLSTQTVDYFDWTLSIDDPNDSNGNGIPDLSDDPFAVEKRPLLRLTMGPSQLLLSISGVSGRTYDLEHAAALNATEWTRRLSIALTNDSQVVILPLPDAATGFWRLRGR